MSKSELEKKVEKFAKEWEQSLGNNSKEVSLYLKFTHYAMMHQEYTPAYAATYCGPISKPNPDSGIKEYKAYLHNEMDYLYGKEQGHKKWGETLNKKYWVDALKQVEKAFPEYN